MFNTIAEFEGAWLSEVASTRKVFQALTDDSLAQSVAGGHRTLGRIAWHITTTIPEMMRLTGLKLGQLEPDAPVPDSAEEIDRMYAAAAGALMDEVRIGWQDDTLGVEDDLYGEKWQRRFTLQALIHHQVHHRGQMTILMRQAGLKVPGIYGPAKEDWSQYGQTPPKV